MDLWIFESWVYHFYTRWLCTLDDCCPFYEQTNMATLLWFAVLVPPAAPSLLPLPVQVLILLFKVKSAAEPVHPFLNIQCPSNTITKNSGLYHRRPGHKIFSSMIVKWASRDGKANSQLEQLWDILQNSSLCLYINYPLPIMQAPLLGKQNCRRLHLLYLGPYCVKLICLGSKWVLQKVTQLTEISRIMKNY